MGIYNPLVVGSTLTAGSIFFKTPAVPLTASPLFMERIQFPSIAGSRHAVKNVRRNKKMMFRFDPVEITSKFARDFK